MKSLFFSSFFCLFFCLGLSAQNPSGQYETFDRKDLKFDYPVEWTLTDKSTADVQTLYLTKPGTAFLFIISSPFEVITQRDQFENLQSDAYTKFVEAVSKSLTDGKRKPLESSPCLNFNGRTITGTKLSGFYNGQPTTGEIYPFALGRRFLTLVYLRPDKDEETGNAVWYKLIKTFSLDHSNKEAFASAMTKTSRFDGVLNAKALKLVQPTISKDEYRAGARGIVVVRVKIDETGKVTEAKAISGHKLLYDNAEFAAKSSKFTPTVICDVPVKVSGNIVYNFVP